MPHPDVKRVVLNRDLSEIRAGLFPGLKGTIDPLSKEFPHIARDGIPIVVFDNGTIFPVHVEDLSVLEAETNRFLTGIAVGELMAAAQFLIDHGCSLNWLKTQVAKQCVEAEKQRRKAHRAAPNKQ